MRLRQLGDSNDAFKWDYHDYLITKMRYPLFNICLMLTTDGHKMSKDALKNVYPARDEINQFCDHLRNHQSLKTIKTLSKRTPGAYKVKFHQDLNYLHTNNRTKYFSDIAGGEKNQMLLLTPSIGFQKKNTRGGKFLQYNDLPRLVSQISDRSIISVCQHYRETPFADEFTNIKKGIFALPENAGIHATAIYWYNMMMFVILSKNERTIRKVRMVNKKFMTYNQLNALH